MKNLNKVVRSEFGFKQITEIINDNNDFVVIEFFTSTIRTNIESFKYLEKIKLTKITNDAKRFF